MTLSIMSMPMSANSYVKLREVSTEEEAFAEMRRYLEVNNIFSDTTTISKRMYEGRGKKESFNKFIKMGSDVEFQIHYENEPDYESIQDAITRSSSFAYSYKNKDKPGFNSLKVLRHINEYGSTVMSWFPDEYDRYTADLIKRVGEICH